MDVQPRSGDLPALRICLLGGFSVTVAGTAIYEDAWQLQRARTLIKLLALAPSHRLHREQIIYALWGERVPIDPANSLHQVVRAARQAFATAQPEAGAWLAFEGEQLCLSARSAAAAGYDMTDVEAFEAAATHAVQVGSVAAYRAAIAVYTGDLLPEDRYAEWASMRRARLSSQFVDLLLGLARTLEAQQAHAEAIETLRRVVLSDPAHEEARVRLMRLHALRGAPGEAEREYVALAAALAEIGAHPGRMSQQLRADIQSGRFSAAHPGASPPLPGEASSAVETGAPATNLPFDTSRFIGRSREAGEVVALLAEARLVTVTGAGGGGKTRLALHVARSLVGRYRDGVWLVELAALGQPSLVAQATAAALQVPERGGTSATESLIAALDDKQLLLVLDNCEHLIEACAHLVETLLRRCPDLRVLCTSREALHIAGEAVWRIAALSLPDPRRVPEPAAPADLDQLARCEAVELFLDRARAARPSFALTTANARTVAQICRRLDGLPLALELAAALVGSVPLEQIAAQLDRCFDLLIRGSRTALTRQQTLRGALDWSFDLLPESQRVVFRRLAVFASRFDLAAAHAVAAGDGVAESGQTWVVLNELIEKSLVDVDASGEEARYSLLEPVRQYAEQRLVEAGEASHVHLWHAQWFARVSERADAALWSAEHEAAMARLEANRANVRAALGWWLRSAGTTDEGLRHAQALWQFWLLRGAFAEGRSWLERLTALAPRFSGERANALLCAVGLEVRLATYSSERTHLMAREALDVYRMLGDAAGEGRALRFQGMLAYLAGHSRPAEASFQESLDLSREAGEGDAECLALNGLGMAAWQRGNLDEAHTYLDRCLQGVRRGGGHEWRTLALMNPSGMPFSAGSTWIDQFSEETWILLRSIDRHTVEAYTLAHLGSLARCRGDFALARSLQEEAGRLFERRDDREGMAQIAGQLGNLARVEGDYAAARAHLRESLRLRRTLGDRRGIFIAVKNLGLLAVSEGDFARAEELYARSYAYGQKYGDVSALFMVLQQQAHLASIKEDFQLARDLNQRLLDLKREFVSSPFDEALVHARLGEIALKQGDRAAARASYTECLVNFTRMGNSDAATTLRTILADLDASAFEQSCTALPGDTGA